MLMLSVSSVSSLLSISFLHAVHTTCEWIPLLNLGVYICGAYHLWVVPALESGGLYLQCIPLVSGSCSWLWGLKSAVHTTCEWLPLLIIGLVRGACHLCLRWAVIFTYSHLSQIWLRNISSLTRLRCNIFQKLSAIFDVGRRFYHL
jgi:hypothetical protein